MCVSLSGSVYLPQSTPAPRPCRHSEPESANRRKVIAFLSPWNSHWKYLTSHGVPAGPKLCLLAYHLINIYIFLHLHPSVGKCYICQSGCRLKRTHIWIILICLCLSYLTYLFIYFPGIRGVGWFVWRSIRQGAKHGKFAALSAGTDSTSPA